MTWRLSTLRHYQHYALHSQNVCCLVHALFLKKKLSFLYHYLTSILLCVSNMPVNISDPSRTEGSRRNPKQDCTGVWSWLSGMIMIVISLVNYPYISNKFINLHQFYAKYNILKRNPSVREHFIFGHGSDFKFGVTKKIADPTNRQSSHYCQDLLSHYQQLNPTFDAQSHY